MDNLNDAKNESYSAGELVHVEAEIEERAEVIALPFTGEIAFVELVRTELKLDPDVHLFERNHDEPFIRHPRGRKHIRLVGHRCREIAVTFQYDTTKLHHFAPSTTVFKALQWAVSKHGFDLDAMAAAKANLILPGADAPLPREDVLGKFVQPGHCALTVDLTLKDFTNG